MTELRRIKPADVDNTLVELLKPKSAHGTSGVHRLFETVMRWFDEAAVQYELMQLARGPLLHVAVRPPFTRDEAPVPTVGLVLHLDVLPHRAPSADRAAVQMADEAAWTRRKRRGYLTCTGASTLSAVAAWMHVAKAVLEPVTSGELRVGLELFITGDQLRPPDTTFAEFVGNAGLFGDALERISLWVSADQSQGIGTAIRGLYVIDVEARGVRMHDAYAEEEAISLAMLRRFWHERMAMPWLDARFGELKPALNMTREEGWDPQFNQYPESARATWVARFLPDQSPLEIQAQLESNVAGFNRDLRERLQKRQDEFRARVPDAEWAGADPEQVGISLKPGGWYPPVEISETHRAVVALKEAVGGAGQGQDPADLYAPTWARTTAQWGSCDAGWVLAEATRRGVRASVSVLEWGLPGPPVPPGTRPLVSQVEEAALGWYPNAALRFLEKAARDPSVLIG